MLNGLRLYRVHVVHVRQTEDTFYILCEKLKWRLAIKGGVSACDYKQRQITLRTKDTVNNLLSKKCVLVQLEFCVKVRECFVKPDNLPEKSILFLTETLFNFWLTVLFY